MSTLRWLAGIRPINRWSISRWNLVALAFALSMGAQACRHHSAAPVPSTGAVASLPAEEKPPASFNFKCGTSVCDARTSYCEMIKTDVPELPSDFACKPLPSSCRTQGTSGTASCDCFPERTRCGFCSKLENNGVYHFQRTCIGGY